MDVSFPTHLDQLIERLKSELVQHYEKDLAFIRDSSKASSREIEVTPHGHESPHILRLAAGKSFFGARGHTFSGKSLVRRPVPVDSEGSSDELEPVEQSRQNNPPRLHSKSAVSVDSEATEVSDSELKTPKVRSNAASVWPTPPAAPKAPKDSPQHPFIPSVAPKMLLPAKVAPQISDSSSQTEAVTLSQAVTSLLIPTHHQPSAEDASSASTSQAPSPVNSARAAPSVNSARGGTSARQTLSVNSARGGNSASATTAGRRGSTAGAGVSVNQESSRQPTKDTQASSARTSTTSSSSSASFETSSDENAPKVPFPASRLQIKRPSNASVSLFFRREAAVSRVWLFLQDPDSSSAAWYYANIMNYFIAATIIFTVWQAAHEPPVSRFYEGIAQITIEGLLLVEFVVHWISSAQRLAFLKNLYNAIDFLAIVPLAFRLGFGIATPTVDENFAVHSLLYCFVPVVRQLKLIRKFQKLQLLLHVLSTTFDALKMLLFLVCGIVLFFGCILYVLEPAQSNQSLSESIYLCTVTVTTVGTCDMAPITWPGKIIAGVLCLISVLFMAMPLSVLGNAMSNTWADRHRILLMTQTRRRLKNLGYTAEDMPKLFKKFDKDGNGDLEMEEFCDLVATMRVGIKPSEASELFMAFDANGDGGISEMEFMKALFPLDYRRIYRRMSGMTFGA